MRLTGFLDFNGTLIEDQIEVAKALDIKNILLRKINDSTILDVSDEEIVGINNALKLSKINVLAIDPLIRPYDLFDATSYERILKKYHESFIIAKKLKVNKVYFRLPIIKNIIDEFPMVEKQLTPIIEEARRNNIILLIYPEKINSNAILYILKHYKAKNLSAIFNPKQHLINNDSPTVAYRLLRNDTKFFMAADIDEKNNPELLGYGKLKIIDMFKRLNRDKYNGYIILDDSFNDFIVGKEDTKRPWYKRIFKSDEKYVGKYLQKYASRIYPKQPEEEINIIDIYLNQIQVLNVVFNLNR